MVSFIYTFIGWFFAGWSLEFMDSCS